MDEDKNRNEDSQQSDANEEVEEEESCDDQIDN